jgi:hypothetical protein
MNKRLHSGVQVVQIASFCDVGGKQSQRGCCDLRPCVARSTEQKLIGDNSREASTTAGAGKRACKRKSSCG